MDKQKQNETIADILGVYGEEGANYTDCLNLMNIAERCIANTIWDKWCIRLYKVVESNMDIPEDMRSLTDFLEPIQIAGLMAGATSSQRAEALLRTMGLWEEEDKATT